MAVIGILQARTNSTRLPGKVLMNILGEPMILQQLRRLKECVLLDDIIVATSSEKSDDDLAMACAAAGYRVFRGSLDDVLDRFVKAVKNDSYDHVVRLTADCPLTDPNVIDHIIERHLQLDCDYTSNTLKPTYPDGLDAEIFKMSALLNAWENAILPSHREHVTPYIYAHPEIFSLNNYENDRDLSAMRWTVDEVEDFEFATEVYRNLYPSKANFAMDDVLKLLADRPDIAAKNAFISRNEGSKKSLLQDKVFLANNEGRLK
ncbi:glycosyltransferase family protein [Pseudomonadales bacterium]|nr:glycosyltransferase family protein [Pseudomonadales bacterium]